MGENRIYELDPTGHILRSHDLLADCDAEAVQLTRAIGLERDWELWQGPRKVATSSSPDR